MKLQPDASHIVQRTVWATLQIIIHDITEMVRTGIGEELKNGGYSQRRRTEGKNYFALFK